MKTSERPWTVDTATGNLVELRVNRLDSVDEVKRFADAIVKAGTTVPDAVLLVDLRAPAVFTQPVANAVVELMTRANKVRRKTAILLSDDHAVFSMQLSRLVRQVGDPNRQTFTDPDTLLEWLSDRLTAAERARAKGFLGLPRRSSTSSE